MATTGASLVPVMILFGMENSACSYKLFAVNKSDTLEDLIEKFGPEEWGSQARKQLLILNKQVLTSSILKIQFISFSQKISSAQ